VQFDLNAEKKIVRPGFEWTVAFCAQLFLTLRSDAVPTSKQMVWSDWDMQVFEWGIEKQIKTVTGQRSNQLNYVPSLFSSG
jgi:hypothetical protein